MGKTDNPSRQGRIVDERSSGGVEITVPESYKGLEERMLGELSARLSDKPKASEMVNLLLADKAVNASWDMADYIAVGKLHYNDHGDTHAIITASFSAQMLDILASSGRMPDIVRDGFGDLDDAMLIVVSAALLHDIGNQVHRLQHPLFSAVLASPILDRLLPKIYGDGETVAEIKGFILHAIFSHESGVRSLTDEASIVCIADGCDMFKGRGRLPFDMGNINIHTVSALSIDDISVSRGEKKPLRITVEMENSAGVFQVEELLAKKVESGTLRDAVEIVAVATPRDAQGDRRIVSRIAYEGGRFVPF